MTHPCRSLSQKLMARYPSPFFANLYFPPALVRVFTNSENLAEFLTRYYREFLAPSPVPHATELTVYALETSGEDVLHGVPLRKAPPEPGKPFVKEAYADFADGRVIRKLKTGMAFIITETAALAAGACLCCGSQVVNFINNRYIARLVAGGGLLAHAAGVAVNGAGIALAGVSGAGKSTLALHLMNAGAVFVSNDRLVLRSGHAGPMMYGVAKHPRVNPGAALANPFLSGVIPGEERPAYEALNDDDLWVLEHKYDVFIDAVFGPGRFAAGAPLGAVAVLNWKRGAGAFHVLRPDIEDRPDLIAIIRKTPGLFCLIPGGPPERKPRDADYTNLLKRRPVYEFVGGVDFPGATEFIARVGAGEL